MIRDGIRRMKAIGADVVLIDPQFAPKVIAKPEIEDMVDLISRAAKQENVDVFHRFALMRHWHDIDGMPFEAFLSPDGLHMNDWSYNCFAKALAQCCAQAWTVMVLHDLPTGAMRNLERFLDAVVELGTRLRQDFAPECVPILDGRIVRPIDDILASSP